MSIGFLMTGHAMAAGTLSATHDAANPRHVTFKGGAGPAVHFGGVLLDFGDGTSERFCGPGLSCDANSTSHTYARDGMYKAALVAIGEGQREVLAETDIKIGSHIKKK